MIHLTLTGPHAGMPGCLLVRYGIPENGWGNLYPIPEGDTGAHYAYAPASLTDGTDPRACPDCVAAFRDAG